MKFNFHLAACANNNTPTAKRREGQRLACIALAMSHLGHESVIVSVSDDLRSSPRWKPFQHLFGGDGYGIDVHPAGVMRGRDRIIGVGFKCSVGLQHDEWFLNHCKVLVAHEYDPAFDSHPSLLPVPFMVHDSVMDQLLEDGLFEAFIKNDLTPIREKYGRPKSGLLGMKACVHYPRRLFCEGAPDWADLELYDYQTMTPKDHMPWISSFRGGLALSGTTPKTNLPSLLALLGVAIVSPPLLVRDTPPISSRNAIIFESWEQVKSELEDDGRLRDVVSQATEDYVNCWSPMGQARLIAERFDK